jgi:hypothetical protein
MDLLRGLGIGWNSGNGKSGHAGSLSGSVAKADPLALRRSSRILASGVRVA